MTWIRKTSNLYLESHQKAPPYIDNEGAIHYPVWVDESKWSVIQKLQSGERDYKNPALVQLGLVKIKTDLFKSGLYLQTFNRDLFTSPDHAIEILRSSLNKYALQGTFALTAESFNDPFDRIYLGKDYRDNVWYVNTGGYFTFTEYRIAADFFYDIVRGRYYGKLYVPEYIDPNTLYDIKTGSMFHDTVFIGKEEGFYYYV